MRKDKTIKSTTLIIAIIFTSMLLGYIIGGMFSNINNSNDIQINVGQASTKDKVNINRASLEELEVLEGIGKTKALNIVKNRPYNDKYELLSKNIIGKEVFNKHIERWVVE